MKNLKHIISNTLHRKARAALFIFTVLLIVLIYPLRTQAGELYTDTKKNGIMFISTTPIQEKHEIRVQRTDSYRTMTPHERRTFKNEHKAQQKQSKEEWEERGKLLLLYSIFK